MKKTLYILFALMSLLGIQSSCTKKKIPSLPRPTENYRTVLVYLGVDNNFSSEVNTKIETLRKNWKRSYAGNLLVFADRRYDDPFLVHIYNDDKGVNVVDTIKTVDWSDYQDSADPRTIKKVLEEVKKGWPSDNYGLVLLSHATGWLPADVPVNNPTRSVVVDDQSGNSMDIVDFVDALPYDLEFIVFDACFMASVEAAYQMKDKVGYLVSSPAEVLVPDDRGVIIYSTMMERLMTSSRADLKAVAGDFYNYFNVLSGSWRSSTMSVVDLSAMEPLASLCEEVLRGYEDGEGLVEEIQGFGYWNDRKKIYFDLGHYIETLAPGQFGRLNEALAECVVYKTHTPRYTTVYGGTARQVDIDHFSGLTVYIPQSAFGNKMNPYYKKLAWYERVGTFVP